jgi:hypothetical protein
LLAFEILVGVLIAIPIGLANFGDDPIFVFTGCSVLLFAAGTTLSGASSKKAIYAV